MPAEANLPVGPVVVCAEQQYPDALQRDPAAGRVPKLDVLAILGETGRIGVELIDEEVTIAPGWEVRWGIGTSGNN